MQRNSQHSVRRGGSEEIPLFQGKEQRLRSAGAAVKRYPTSKLPQRPPLLGPQRQLPLSLSSRETQSPAETRARVKREVTMADEQSIVKVFFLNDDQQWEMLGKGHVSTIYVERLQGLCLLVRSELSGLEILESKINPDTPYQRRQGTLIVWSEAENHGMAISFPDAASCHEIWKDICQVQGKDPSTDITHDPLVESEDETLDDVADDVLELPNCELVKYFAEIPVSWRRRRKGVLMKI
ncbi:hypothetical protein ABFV05_020654 [Capra hircus]